MGSLLSESGLEAVARAVAMFEWPLPRERDEAACTELAHLVDGLFALVARGKGALDLAIGDGLDVLGKGDRALRLGCSSIGDYARERLDINASTAVKMARLAGALRERPLVRAAVRSGEITPRQAEAILRVARGDDEAVWVARARTGTVRGLKAAQQEPEPQEEKWDRFRVNLPSDVRPIFDKAVDLAGKILGRVAPKWQRILAICQEFLSAHPPPPAAVDTGGSSAAAPDDGLGAVKQWLERETEQWASLRQWAPVAAPDLTPDAEVDPRVLHRDLLRFSEMRRRWDEFFGCLALVFIEIRGWERLGFASFGHYSDERLGMSERAVEQRAALERRLHELPAVRQAMREGRLSYEKARLLARHGDEATATSWIERAGQMSCVELRRALDEDQDGQMCAREEVVVVAPREVRAVLGLTFEAARKAAGTRLSPGECLRMVSQHFVDTWGAAGKEQSTVQKKVLARDRGWCQVPGCSRPAVQAHHIIFRSAGGTDDPKNLVSLCVAHHLLGVHMGRIKVTGEAPDRLHWQLGIFPGEPPLLEVPPRSPT